MPDVREKLVELLCEAHSKATDAEAFTDATYAQQLEMEADHLIRGGVTIQRWIPAAERLPEDDLPKDGKVKRIKVLVAYRTNGNWIVRTQVRAKGYWYSEPDKWDWIKERDPITHWMPLPEPPKGE